MILGEPGGFRATDFNGILNVSKLINNIIAIMNKV